MSGNCKVNTQIGQYKCLSCLELVLDLLNLKEKLKITPIQNRYEISLQDSTERYELNHFDIYPMATFYVIPESLTKEDRYE